MFLVADSTLSLKNVISGKNKPYRSTFEKKGFKARNCGSRIMCGGTATDVVLGLREALEHNAVRNR
eukprot:6326418-Prorocentrum_lima.AAC.1